jgi:hypothetical protein
MGELVSSQPKASTPATEFAQAHTTAHAADVGQASYFAEISKHHARRRVQLRMRRRGCQRAR